MSFFKRNKMASTKRKKKGIIISIANVLDLIRMILIASITFILISIVGMFFVDKYSDSMVIYTIVVIYNIILSIVAIIAYKKLDKKKNAYD